MELLLPAFALPAHRQSRAGTFGDTGPCRAFSRAVFASWRCAAVNAGAWAGRGAFPQGSEGVSVRTEGPRPGPAPQGPWPGLRVSPRPSGAQCGAGEGRGAPTCPHLLPGPGALEAGLGRGRSLEP